MKTAHGMAGGEDGGVVGCSGGRGCQGVEVSGGLGGGDGRLTVQIKIRSRADVEPAYREMR